jgi:predicted dehydrogenase
VTGEEARRTLEVVLAGLKSVDEGKPVKLPLTGEVL